MLNRYNSYPFISDETLEEINVLQEVVSHGNDTINLKAAPKEFIRNWDKTRLELAAQTKEFNRKQESRVLPSSAILTTEQLLPFYTKHHIYIQASQKDSLTDYKSFIIYRKAVSSFSRLFQLQHSLQNEWTMVYDAFSSYAHCIYENARCPINGKYIYGCFSQRGNNPYPYKSYIPLIDTSIEKSDIASISSAKRYLERIFQAICGDSIEPITGNMVKRLIPLICAKKPVTTLIDAVVHDYIYNRTNSISSYSHSSKTDSAYAISRHVSWCIHRGENTTCTLLDQPCHASVDCAFYRENASKK